MMQRINNTSLVGASLPTVGDDLDAASLHLGAQNTDHVVDDNQFTTESNAFLVKFVKRSRSGRRQLICMYYILMIQHRFRLA